jgi:hypothetical protein
MRHWCRASVFLSILAVSSWPSTAATLALRKDFVKQVKARATLSVSFHVDVHPKKPHGIGKGAEDGDIHMGGRSDEVRLPLVAEIMNAKSEAKALALMNQTSSSQPVDVSGVWRIWFEHPGKGAQIQGQKVPVPSSSNPDHVFELHPLTVFDGANLKPSLRPISQGEKKFQAYAAKTAFPKYEGLKATVKANDTAVMIASTKAGYNYVEFEFEPIGEIKAGADALFILAKIYDTSDPEEPVTPEPRRMVFVKGTPPAAALQKLAAGERLHVLGIPRVSLQDVWEIVVQEKGKGTFVRLPYEIVVVGVYSEEDAEP